MRSCTVYTVYTVYTAVYLDILEYIEYVEYVYLYDNGVMNRKHLSIKLPFGAQSTDNAKLV